MDMDTLAHRGTHAGEQPVDWKPAQVQSGPDDGLGAGQAAAGMLTRGLGWFSLGLGLAQVVAPERVVRLVGAPVTGTSVLITRLMGAREISHGLGVLSSARPVPWMWTRVAGDVLDLGLLSRAGGASGSRPVRVAGAMAAVVGTTAADVFDALQLRDRAEPVAAGRPMRVKAAVTIDRSAADIYRYWRHFENLPDIMAHLKSVEVLDETRSRWTVRAPLGSSATWEAEIVEDVEEQVVAWQSVPGSTIDNSGEVRLMPAPGDRGTELHVLLRYELPAGAVGAALAKLFGDDPVQQVKDDLRRFKQVMETGQVVRSDGAPSGTDARLQPKQRPARPGD